MVLALYKQNHIEAWQASGLSQRDYCRQHGLNAKTFANWLRIYRNSRMNAKVKVPMLIPVTIKPEVSSTATESPRDCRRLFSLSQATSADPSSWQ